MAKNRTIGDLIACEHCRNAYEEMEMLDEAFQRIIDRSPDFPMSNWDALRAQMPDWAEIRERYRKKQVSPKTEFRVRDTMEGRGNR